MTETPHGRYSYPGPGEAVGSWNGTPERIWAQQEIEITGEVETWEDLPDLDVAAETDDGQRRVFRVVEDKLFARDNGDSWTVIGGTGSPERPVPEGHYETFSTDDASINDRQIFVQDHPPEGADEEDVWIDTRGF